MLQLALYLQMLHAQLNKSDSIIKYTCRHHRLFSCNAINTGQINIYLNN